MTGGQKASISAINSAKQLLSKRLPEGLSLEMWLGDLRIALGVMHLTVWQKHESVPYCTTEAEQAQIIAKAVRERLAGQSQFVTIQVAPDATDRDDRN